MRFWVSVNQVIDSPLLWITANKHPEIVCVKFEGVIQVIRNQPHKALIKTRKSTLGELFARFGKGLDTCFAGQIGLIGEMGKKCIQFSLNAGPETRNHGNQHDGKAQNALAN